MKKFFKYLFIISLIAIVLIGGYYLYMKYIGNNGKRDAFALVPKDAIFVIETSNLSQAWTTLSESKLWNHLIANPYFADINSDIKMVDEYLKANKMADMVLNNRKLLISAHMISGTDWDFVYYVDLQSAAKTFKNLSGALGLIDGYTIQTREFKTKDALFPAEIIEIINNADKTDVIYMSLVDNVLIVSYQTTLLENAITQKDSKYWNQNKRFQRVLTSLDENQLFRFYYNYEMMPQFARTFLTEENEIMTMLGTSLAYSGMDINLKEERLFFDGYTNLDSVSSYIRALAGVNPGKIRAHEILSDQAAAYISIGFSDYNKFYNNLLNEYQTNNPEAAEEINDNIELIEKLLSISVKEDFFSWIGTEVALLKLRPISQTREEDVVVAINANDIENAKKGMGHIIDQIRKRSPFKFEAINYKNFPINMLEQKGFFKPFFGKLFAQMERPYFTYIEDYVVFSNSQKVLMQVIDDYVNGRTLSHNAKFNTFREEFDTKTNLSVFIQMPKIYENLYYYSTPENKKGVEENRDLILSFARIGFSLSSDGEMFKTTMISEFDEDALVEDHLELLEATSSDQLFYENIDSLEFKVKLTPDILATNQSYKKPYSNSDKTEIEGNIIKNQPNGIWRTYYPSGKLKSSVNYKDGKVEGIAYFYFDSDKNNVQAEVKYTNDKVVDIYKEFYENGAQKATIPFEDNYMDGDAEFYYETGRLKIKGEYKDGKKTGKWKYYDENGEVISKEKWRKGKRKGDKDSVM